MVVTSWERPSLPSVSEILALPELVAGRPLVLAGAERLTNRVRWLHTHENPDIAAFLSGGELLLTTGIMLPENREGLTRYVDSLVDADASGLIVEAGRRFKQLPGALIAAAAKAHFPLILLQERVRFVRATEAGDGLILNDQLTEFRARQDVEKTFTELALEQAPVSRVVLEASRLLGCPVVLENFAHQPIAFEPDNISELLMNWEQRSRGLGGVDQTTTVSQHDTLLAAPVGARGVWARLVAVLDHDRPLPRESAIIEHAALTLSLSALHSVLFERHAHDSLIGALAGEQPAAGTDLESRLRTLGLPVNRRLFAAASIAFDWAKSSGPGTVDDELFRRAVEAVARSTQEASIPCVVGVLAANAAGVLLSISPAAQLESELDRFAAAVHAAMAQFPEKVRIVIGIGAMSVRVAGAKRSFSEAAEIAKVAASLGDDRPYYRLQDLRLRGLISVLQDDARLQAFVESELAKLIEYDQLHGTSLVNTLESFVRNGGNKAFTSREIHISRPSLYERLRRIEAVLGVSLEAPESQLALHVAVLALAALREGGEIVKGGGTQHIVKISARD